MQEIKADLVGLLTLAMLLLFFTLLPPVFEVPAILWLFIYFALMACSLFIWKKHPEINTPSQWFLIVIYSSIAAIIWFFYSRMTSTIIWGGSESDSSKFIDIAITLMLAPGLLSIALSAWVRALYIKYFSSNRGV